MQCLWIALISSTYGPVVYAPRPSKPTNLRVGVVAIGVVVGVVVVVVVVVVVMVVEELAVIVIIIIIVVVVAVVVEAL